MFQGPILQLLWSSKKVWLFCFVFHISTCMCLDVWSVVTTAICSTQSRSVSSGFIILIDPPHLSIVYGLLGLEFLTIGLPWCVCRTGGQLSTTQCGTAATTCWPCCWRSFACKTECMKQLRLQTRCAWKCVGNMRLSVFTCHVSFFALTLKIIHHAIISSQFKLQYHWFIRRWAFREILWLAGSTEGPLELWLPQGTACTI